MCVALLDDFFDKIKFHSKAAWGRAKDFVSDNKGLIYDLIGNLVSTAVPAARPIVDGLRSAYGGPRLS